jgi:hypothetical protein
MVVLGSACRAAIWTSRRLTPATTAVHSASAKRDDGLGRPNMLQWYGHEPIEASDVTAGDRAFERGSTCSTSGCCWPDDEAISEQRYEDRWARAVGIDCDDVAGAGRAFSAAIADARTAAVSLDGSR